MKIKHLMDEFNEQQWLKISGIHSDDWFNPNKSHELCGTTLKNFHEAYELLMAVCNKPNAKIYVQVDSDCDGYTSAAQIVNYINNAFPLVEVVYGLWSEKQHGLDLDELRKHPNVDLVIVPDASVRESYIIEYLQTNEIELIELDHHETKLTNTHIVINPHLESFPNKELSGATVVLKFLQGVDKLNQTSYAENYYDIAAIGMIADVMTAYNLDSRYIITQGLNNLHHPFIKHFLLANEFSVGVQLTPIGVSFYLAPLINALIRVGEQTDKIKFFEVLAQIKDNANDAALRVLNNAKNKQKRITDTAVPQIYSALKANGNLNHKLITAISPPAVPKTLTGLVANKLADITKKPVLLGKHYGEFFRGSGRNVENSPIESLKDFLLQTNLMEYVAGHGNAHGFSIPQENLDELISYAEETMPPYEACHTVVCKITPNQIKPIAELLDKYKTHYCSVLSEPLFELEFEFNPFGDNFQLIGKTNNTAKFTLSDFTAIKFNSPNFELPKTKCIVRAVGRVNLNEWNGNITPQFMITDCEYVECDKYSIF